MKKYDLIFTDPRMTMRKREKIQYTYSGMKRRVKRHPYYIGIPLCSKEDFYVWSQANDEFHRIYDYWEANDKLHKLTASIDKHSKNTGYTIGFMSWMPFGEHMAKDEMGNSYMKGHKHTDEAKAKMAKSGESNPMFNINSDRQIALRIGVSNGTVSRWRRNGVLEIKMQEYGSRFESL